MAVRTGSRFMVGAIIAALALTFEMIPPPAVAQPAPRDALAGIRARRDVAVCMWPQYFAISYRNPRNSELEGIDIDMARALAARLGVTLRFVETNFASFMDRIEAGDCDIAMMAVGVLPARAERVAFSKPYMASPVYGVTTRESSRVNRFTDIDQPGVTVAVAAGTLMEPLMRSTLRQAELLVVRPPATREAEVQAGRADVFMSDFPYTRRMLLMHDWARIIEPPAGFGETLYAYAVARGDAAWLAEVNAFLEAAKSDGTLARAAARHGLTPIILR
jgi:ABC-type amino acid transport substrate-binding protein